MLIPRSIEQFTPVSEAVARAFYEAESLCGGWSVRQLDRQISTLFYERTLLSRNKAAVLKKGTTGKADEKPTPMTKHRTTELGLKMLDEWTVKK